MITKLLNLFKTKSHGFSNLLFPSSNHCFFQGNYENFSVQGYRDNPVVFACINMISDGAKSVPFQLYRIQGDERVDIDMGGGHDDLIRLLQKPSINSDWVQFVNDFVSYRLLDGNAYILKTMLGNGKVGALELIRPNIVSIKRNKTTGVLEGYEIRWSQTRKEFIEVDPLTGESNLIHVKTFNPFDHLSGLSPLFSAVMGISQHNQASRHNSSILSNGARPSGALIYNSDGGGDQLSTEQINNLRDELKESYEGSGNTGKPMVLSGGLDWKEMGLSPKDIDWLDGKNMSAREIALAFKVPTQLLGLPDAQTFANFEQAKLELWEGAIIPTLYELKEALNRHVTPDGVFVDCDFSEVSALTIRKQKKQDSLCVLVEKGIITRNEAREKMGLEAIDGGDQIFVPASSLPIDVQLDTDILPE